MNDKIKVILVDDHAVVRAGFKMLLSTEAGINVKGSFILFGRGIVIGISQSR